MKQIRRTKNLDSQVPNMDQTLSPTDTKGYVFYLAVLAIFLSSMALLTAGFKGSTASQNTFVVVDMNQLLRQKAASLVQSKGLEGEGDKREMQLESYAKHIRQVIERYASENKVIVASKGAVFGKELEEVTDVIRSRL
jgi:hypothetical protein